MPAQPHQGKVTAYAHSAGPEPVPQVVANMSYMLKLQTRAAGRIVRKGNREPADRSAHSPGNRKQARRLTARDFPAGIPFELIAAPPDESRP
jgi:hypothetical protein